MNLPPITRRELDALSLQRLYSGRNWSKADILIGEYPPCSGQRIVVKDLQESPLWFRLVLGRYLLAREWRALKALQDVDGVPKAMARPDIDSLVMEYCPGKPMSDIPGGALPSEVLQRVEAILKALHDRGVTHGDLHQRNILIDADGAVTIADWATASNFGPHPRGLKARLFQEWCALDNRQLVKLKVYHAPALITEAERELLLQGGSSVYRAIKGLRHFIRRLRGKGRPGEPAPVLKNYLQKNIQSSQKES